MWRYLGREQGELNAISIVKDSFQYKKKERKKKLSNEARIQASFDLGLVFPTWRKKGCQYNCCLPSELFLYTCEQSDFVRRRNCKQLLFYPSKDHFFPVKS